MRSFIAVTLFILMIILYRRTVSKSERVQSVKIQWNIRNKTVLEIEKLAQQHREVEEVRFSKKLMYDVENSYNNIIVCHNFFKREYQKGYRRIQGSEWILDNIYVIEKEYKALIKSIRKSYAKNLPAIRHEGAERFPRVYDLAREIINSRELMNESFLIEYLNKYQSITVLTNRELWALCAMMKMYYIQIISRVCSEVTQKEKDSKKGGEIGNIFIANRENGALSNIINQLNSKELPTSEYFWEALLKTLRDNGVTDDEVELWIEDRLREREINENKIFIMSEQANISYSKAISHSILNLRAIENFNWIKIFQLTSKVEEILVKDPTETYINMDFYSKQLYRNIIEEISRGNNISEIFIAHKLLSCAQGTKKFQFENHIGYYLIDEGRRELNKVLDIDFKGFEKVKNIVKGKAVRTYLLAIGSIILLLSMGFITWSYYNDNDVRFFKYVLAFIVTLIPLSEVVISIFNWSVTHMSKPRTMCKIDLENGVPDEYSTGIIVPTIISSVKRGKELVDNMEEYYLGNRDENLYYILLGDYVDSDKEDEKEDKYISEACSSYVNLLNSKYCTKGKERFFFLCRKRNFNKKENKWMGWERKRGKVEEFNRFIRDDKNTSYITFNQNIKALKNIKFIITLDADTILPRDTAKLLIGAMIHPLNRAYIEQGRNRVWRGYGLMQPRIAVSLQSANETYFSKIFSGNTGIDVYTTAVSDVYQDLFGEGIYTGKAIYDVDVFNSVLGGVIKENTVLSHDLLEGCFLRTALLTDVELIDGYPAYYNSSAKRLHRWVRGDWQLIPWIFRKNSIDGLSKWKIIDNLRRSLVAPSMILLLICSLCMVMPDGLDKWYMSAFIALITPILFDISENAVIPLKSISLSGKVDSFSMALKQVFFMYAFLPFQAYLMIDAIVRTLWRMGVTKCNLLQWQTAEEAERTSGKDIESYIRYMWSGSLIGLIILSIAFINSMNTFLVMLPSGLLWFISPWIAYRISKTNKHKIYLEEHQRNLIRRVSRKTFAYFQDFIGEETNYLGPDNFQEEPYRGIAMRTSPTNIGLGLMSNIVGVDMGYLGIIEALSSINKTLDTMEKLESYKGHFYNWYDIGTLKPLFPRYISTVDSGNLVAYLYVIQQGLKDFIEKPYANGRVKGIKDTIELALLEVKDESLQERYKESYRKIIRSHKNIEEIYQILLDLKEIMEGNICRGYWNSKLLHEINSYIEEITYFFPWIKIDNEKFNKLEEYNILNIENKCSLQNICDSIGKVLSAEGKDIVSDIIISLSIGRENIWEFIEKCNDTMKRIDELINNTNFSMLYNSKRRLFYIGYDIENQIFTDNYYDLLASEARITSYIAIARGEVSKEHWFTLSRALTKMGNRNGLASWSGTMFEYYMPRLILKNFENSLWSETYSSVVNYQMEYCMNKGIPFGISESGYYTFDLDLNYQYKAFGVPKIGLKRGLEDDLVVSPYSSVMSLMENIPNSIKNLELLISLGMEGKYGFYEALDYTKGRRKNEKYKIIKSFMIHHLGMSLLAIDNVINHDILQRRFHDIPIMKSCELLLQEKNCKNVVFDRAEDNKHCEEKSDNTMIYIRNYNKPITKFPKTQLLSNGKYSTMIESCGSGYSKIDDTFVYRWREDIVNRNNGMFFYIKDLTTEDFTSTTFEPCRDADDSYKVKFYPYKAEFIKAWRGVSINTSVYVLSKDDCELRRITLENNSKEERKLQLTSYCEIVLQTYDGDLAHPAFGNLFVTTEYINELNGVIARRRTRSERDREKYVLQRLLVEDGINHLEYETARLNFVGRGNSKKNPISITSNLKLSESVGNVLDPIISLRGSITLKPGEKCIFNYITVVGNSKEHILTIASRYDNNYILDEVIDNLQRETKKKLLNRGIKPPQMELYESVGSSIIYLNSSYRNREGAIERINKNQSSLWAYGISGDLPIILVILEDEKHSDIVRQTICCNEYLGHHGLKIDLVIIASEPISYEKPLQTSIKQIVLNSSFKDMENRPGGIFIQSSATMNKEDIELLKGISSLVLYGNKGSLWDQVALLMENVYCDTRNHGKIEDGVCKVNSPLQYDINTLKFFNGYGGFNEIGEYIIVLKDNISTPAPWINVISNKDFGFHISEVGSSYTWYKNSREFKITPWNNDFIEDTLSEVTYIKDEESSDVWTITPEPIRHKGEYMITHGFGYSKFNCNYDNILGELKTFVPSDDTVKVLIVKLKNNESRRRNLSVTYYAKLAMGAMREHNYKKVYTHINKGQGYIYARNPYSSNFSGSRVFLKTFGGESQSFTGDRSSFIGMLGSLSKPEMMDEIDLNNLAGEGLDPCLCNKVHIVLEPFEEKEVVIILGTKEQVEDIDISINRYKDLSCVKREFENCTEQWNKLLGKIKVTTPDQSFNLMLNGWLMYQTISCRLFSRTGFYQSGGAFGFRDQLQDVIPLIYLDPAITREHILYAASRQFEEGDVEHWWHPVVDSGIRTRFSDDLLWLPYVTSIYVKETGDYTILNEKVRYLSGEELQEGEDERYNIYDKSSLEEELYLHCIKAIERSLKFGTHNLPLMGSGDWNDGMSEVGNKGKGESVWLGWFLYDLLNRFIEVCNYKKDFDRSKNYKHVKEFIRDNIEANAWDGEWYRRAYFDDGTPLGSKDNSECKIDALAQCWSVISDGGDHERTEIAMESLKKNLIKSKEQLILLLTPPFNKSKLNPGYIKSYVPGVRENGGQYTHGATWVILAYAKMGRSNEAYRLYSMLNSISHGDTTEKIENFKTEPYVMSADVYSEPPHVGRGGWSWYTGSSGWMYTIGLQYILGMELVEGKGFTIKPCVPIEWENYTIEYNINEAHYTININRGESDKILFNGEVMEGDMIPIMESGEYVIEVTFKS